MARAILLLRYTVNARFLHTSHEGQCCRYHMHRNSVYKSMSSWWVARKFLDNLQTESPRRHALATALYITENIGNIGKLRQPPMLKTWHKHGNTPPGETDFYPL